MESLYIPIRTLHVAAVLTSGTLFFVRGLALNVFGARWVMAPPLRYLSYAVDTVLLTAAILLTVILHQYPLAQAWLTAKVALLVVYIGLGTFALKGGRTRQVRLACWVLALLVFAYIVTVAIAHDPLGVFAGRV